MDNIHQVNANADVEEQRINAVFFFLIRKVNNLIINF